MSGQRTFSNSDPSRPPPPNPSTPAGFVRIRRSRFENRSSIDDSNTSGPSSSASSSYGLVDLNLTGSPGSLDTAVTEPDADIAVPINLDSVAALEYIGLSFITSEAIYKMWSKAGSEVQGMDFCRFAEECIAERGLKSSASGDMCKALAKLGASGTLTDQLMTPGHETIRNTKTAHQWLEEAMEMRWEYLVWGREASKARANASPSPGAQSPLTVFKASQTTKLRKEKERKEKAKNRQFTYKIRNGVMAATESDDKVGYTVLYKGTSRVRAERMWSMPYRQGTFAIRSLRSKSPGDFSGTTDAFYFTPELEAAELYANFSKNWCSDAGVCIVAVEVPNRTIEGVDKYILKFPWDEFKKVVWGSKKGNGLGKVNKAAHAADLLIGDTTTDPDSSFTGLADPSQIEEKHLIKMANGDTVTQYVFTDVFEELINEKCKDCTTILHHHHTDQELPPLDIRSKRDKFAIPT